MSFLNGPSGGFSYHFAALRYRESLWTNFIERTHFWLENAWPHSAHELIVFGPSAGWTLSQSFLNRFEKVTAVEPDPIARSLFKWRFRRRGNLEFVLDTTLLPWFSKENRLTGFLAERPNAAILFANLLGQIPLLNSNQATPEKPIATIRREFFQALDGRSWASYHDLISSKFQPLKQTPSSIQTSNIDELALSFFQAGAEVVDHDMLWLSQGHGQQTEVWQLRPTQSHVVGFFHS